MTLESLLEKIPAYAKDMRVNMQNVLKQAELTPQQAWGTAVATALAARNAELLEAVLSSARANISEQAIDAARTASAIMGMNNVYYRFLHLSSNEKYRSIPARLRMQGIRTHGVDQLDFELWCTAVSAINGCGACVDSHEQTLKAQGVTEESIIAAVRIASVMHAVACVLDAVAAG
jgi:lipoyl-dependent peroxiredoxin subunit D